MGNPGTSLPSLRATGLRTAASCQEVRVTSHRSQRHSQPRVSMGYTKVGSGSLHPFYIQFCNSFIALLSVF